MSMTNLMNANQLKCWLLLLVPVFVIGLAGCGAGETPTETYEVPKDSAKQGDMSKAINENPNLPDAAKKAVTGQNR